MGEQDSPIFYFLVKQLLSVNLVIFQVFRRRYTDYFFIALSSICLLSLLQILLTDIPETETKNAVFNSVLAYVQRNFMNDITIGDIAQTCACSESTVSHLFRQYAGKAVKKYIAELRISQAKKLLSTSDLPIGTVAQMCGFSNIGYFPTAFKKAVGVSPTEYRRRQGTVSLPLLVNTRERIFVWDV